MYILKGILSNVNVSQDFLELFYYLSNLTYKYVNIINCGYNVLYMNTICTIVYIIYI